MFIVVHSMELLRTTSPGKLLARKLIDPVTARLFLFFHCRWLFTSKKEKKRKEIIDFLFPGSTWDSFSLPFVFIEAGRKCFWAMIPRHHKIQRVLREVSGLVI